MPVSNGKSVSFPSACFYAEQKIMKKSRGRPATGITPMMGFRADPVIRAEIVQWAENQPDMPSLSAAIRRLVEMGLASASEQPRVLSTSKQSAARAAELAEKAIDSQSDPTASAGEREIRKRKLIKGPSPFRKRDRPR